MEKRERVQKSVHTCVHPLFIINKVLNSYTGKFMIGYMRYIASKVKRPYTLCVTLLAIKDREVIHPSLGDIPLFP